MSTETGAVQGDDRRTARRLPWRCSAAFPEALLANVLNPRAASVYLTLVPQFVGRQDDVLTMTFALVAVHIAMQTVWLSIWTMLVSEARRRLSFLRVRRSLEALSGAILIGVGVRTAVEGAR